MKNTGVMIAMVVIFSLSYTILMGCTDSEKSSGSNEDTDDEKTEDSTFSGCFAELDADTRTENRDYVLKVVKVEDNDQVLSVNDLHFTLYSSDRRDLSNGVHDVIEIYGKPINDRNFISFRDGDYDGVLSVGDRFIIKSYEHVDDDGSTDSPGYAEPGFFFDLKAGETLISEEQIR